MHGCHGRVEGSRDTWEKGSGGKGGKEVEEEGGEERRREGRRREEVDWEG